MMQLLRWSPMHDVAQDAGPLIVIADDHPLMRAALRSVLGALAPAPSFLEAGDAASALAVVASRHDIDLMLIDLHLPGIGGVDGVKALREHAPDLPIVVVSGDEKPGIAAPLLALGVAGYIPKTDAPAVIVGAVQLVLAGGIYVPPRLLNGSNAAAGSGEAGLQGLTQRQRTVLRLLARGQSNKEIARELGISEGTVKVHLLSVFRVLNVRNRTEAVLSVQRFLH